MERKDTAWYLKVDPETLSPVEKDEAIRLLQLHSARDNLLETLYNKGEIERRVAERCQIGESFGVFFIDIDGFKRLNDTFSHAEGDNVLRAVEILLQTMFRREGDETLRISLEIGRYGGDEFLILIHVETEPDVQHDYQRTNDLHEQMYNVHAMLHEVVGQMLRDAEADLLERYPDGNPVNLGISVGTAVYDPTRPVEPIILINQADEAMYEEKKNPR